MKESFESFKIMLNELNLSVILNEIRKENIENLEKEIKKITEENISLKKDLIFINSLKYFK